MPDPIAPGGTPPAAGDAGAPDKAAPPAPPPDDKKTAAPPPAEGADKKDAQDGASSFLGDAAKDAAKEGDGKDSPDKKAEDAWTLAVPEGVTADKPLLDAFTTKARELKLSKEQAQALADVAVARWVEQAKATQTEQLQRAKENRAALEAHPEIGGEKLKTAQSEARNYILRVDREANGLGSKVVQKLAAAGLGDDPDIAMWFVHHARRNGEDKAPVTSTAPGSNPLSQAQERLAKRYPSIKGIQRPGQ